MTYKQIIILQKSLQKIVKTEKSSNDKLFIRHWNVFLNQYKGRNLSMIEPFSRTTLSTKSLNHIAETLKLDQESKDHFFSNNQIGDHVVEADAVIDWRITESSLYKKMMEVASE